MSIDRIEFEGYSATPAVPLTKAQVTVATGQEWVYCEVVGKTLQIWSGPACSQCEGGPSGLKRCQLHHNVQWIALQYRLALVESIEPGSAYSRTGAAIERQES